uniref:Mitogen-activated protein kinase (EC) n=1 Tax=Ganoderma boninense TaxID=34458 RepID=A0A5K1K3F6_9APHY|nr:Mitogen-activated protein kinase (EC [Ganoderma boninense]
MSLVQSTPLEVPQAARHPYMQFDTQMALSSRGSPKRKPAGEFIPVGQVNYPPLLPTKSVRPFPLVQQGWHVPTGYCAPEARDPYAEFLLQNRIAALAQTNARPYVENVSQAHTSSVRTSPSSLGTFPGQPVDTQRTVDGRSQAERPSAETEKSQVAKGKQPDRRWRKAKSRHAPKPGTASDDGDMAQSLFLSFLAHNLMAEQAFAHRAEIAAAAYQPEPALPQQYAPSGFGPAAQQHPEERAMYGYPSPFEGMLVKRSPWPPLPTVMQEMGCECSICVRALAKRLEDAVAPPSAAAPVKSFSLPPEPNPEPRASLVEEPRALEPYFTELGSYGRGLSLSEARFPYAFPAETSPMRMPAPLRSPPRHQFFPHIQEVEVPSAGRGRFESASVSVPVPVSSSRGNCQAEAGPSRPPVRRPASPPGQDLMAMLFAAAMSELGNTVV